MGVHERCYGSLAWGTKEGNYLSSDTKLICFSFLYCYVTAALHIIFFDPIVSGMNFPLNLQDIFRLKFVEDGWSQTSSSKLEAQYLQ